MVAEPGSNLIMQLLRHFDNVTARTDEPTTTEAVSAPERAAELPVETTQAEDPNTEKSR